ncbi:MAG TPA: hypothetical protein VFL83_13155 [Anaeromyxobacter sp.]|nr:hypothetical protein [Anaeromyxobacter sp.]
MPKPKDFLARGWLEALVTAELDRHDPAAALARLPAEVRGAGSPDDLAPAARLLVARSLRRRRVDDEAVPETEAFLDDVRLHVELVLDLALLRGAPFERLRRYAELAAVLAAAAGEWDLAVEALPRRTPEPRAVARALRAAEQALRARLFPPGDPVRGLPLYPGVVAVQRRLLTRVAMGHQRAGRLDLAALERHAAYAAAESALLAEALAGLFAAAEPVDAQARAVRQAQLARLGLPRAALKAVRRAVGAPRSAEAIARVAPERVRPFLVEQLFLAVLRARVAGDGAARFVEAFAGATGLDAAALAAAKVEAAAQHGVHRVWFDALGGKASSWQAFASVWESASDTLVERVSAAVTENLGAIATEIRETGELGALLAKAAAGGTLTAEERRKVRSQLLDLAKAVPALAIFAAPGGMLLLPLLAKLLPFEILPSAWDRTRPPAAPAGEAGPAGRERPKARKKRAG